MKNRRKTLFQAPSVIRQEVKVVPVIREEKVKISKELGKYFLDISKLIIGGAVITTAVNLTSDKGLVINIAISIAILFGLIGFFTLKTLKKE